MGMERFSQSLVGIETAIANIRSAADMLEASIGRTRELIDSGVDVRDLVRAPGTTSRETAIEALNGLHSALMISRAEWYRLLIEQEGMSPSDIARLTGHPRQIVKRRYDALRRKQSDSPPDDA